MTHHLNFLSLVVVLCDIDGLGVLRLIEFTPYDDSTGLRHGTDASTQRLPLSDFDLRGETRVAKFYDAESKI